MARFLADNWYLGENLADNWYSCTPIQTLIEARLQMQMWLKVFTEKHNTSRHYMWRFIADLSAVINTVWAEKKIKTEPHSAKSRSIIDMIETRTTSLGQNVLVEIKKRVFWVFWELLLTVVVFTNTFKNKNSLRTIEAQIVQKLKINEARPEFTGSYKKKARCTVVCQCDHVFFPHVAKENDHWNKFCSNQCGKDK